MHQQELDRLLQRVSRIVAALDAASARASTGGGPALSSAVLDTCWAAVGVASALTLAVAEDELWPDLSGLLGVWQHLRVAVRGVADSGLVDTGPPLVLLEQTLAALSDVSRLVTAAETAQRDLALRSGDRQAAAVLHTTLEDLEGCADRHLMCCLASPVPGHLEAAHAVLTAVAARAARERRLAARRRP